MITLIETVESTVASRRQRAGELLDWLRSMSSDEREETRSVLRRLVRADKRRADVVTGNGFSTVTQPR